MSYQLCANIITTIFNEIPVNKCYNNPQPIETSHHLSLLHLVHCLPNIAWRRNLYPLVNLGLLEHS
ncbi:hypothetical protein RhiirA5_436500 [Rhizophagus irregularis]|uniref:Uncharacterized protein n=1 Tax=Rhizophagus irregularis TaxID=588596 RepID=A0A2N0NLW1_9GLOM|nr:hypothetical protein RhiirA5_436500 [Rhizophagus irregularis]